MVDLDFEPGPRGVRELEDQLRAALDEVDGDAIVRLRLVGSISNAASSVLRAASLRDLAPPTMSVSVEWPRPWRR